MRADVVVDLQFGSTAKGKLCQLLAVRELYDFAVRVQSIQAGHTVIYQGREYKMRTIPCAWVRPETALVLGPGAFIWKQLLLEEIKMLEEVVPDIRSRLYVDYRAYYVRDLDFGAEISKDLMNKIGSTSEGAGASLIRKMWREPGSRVADDDWAIQQKLNVCDTVSMMQDRGFIQQRVLVEGCQGTLLGLHTSPYYPFVTSRECSASAICGEAGIAPADVHEVWGVFRTFPIRVGGNSGPTGRDELTWGEVAEYAGDPNLKPEVTTVTNRERRIFPLSIEDLLHSYTINKPDRLAMTFLDYVNAEDRGKTQWSQLSKKSREFVHTVEQSLQAHIDLVSTGKDPEFWIERS